MEKDVLIEQTISDLYKLSTKDLIQLKIIIDKIKYNLSEVNNPNELKFDWEGSLMSENISSVKLQKEALNWR
jgi:arginyl-tRNA synthetase